MKSNCPVGTTKWIQLNSILKTGKHNVNSNIPLGENDLLIKTLFSTHWMLSSHYACQFFNCDKVWMLVSQYVLRSSGISRMSGALNVRYSQKKECISFVFYCFENLSIAITLEPLVRFRWSFQQNVPFLVRISIK